MATAIALDRITEIPDTLVSLDKDLAVQAAQKLGYGAMTQELQRTDARRELYKLLLNIGVQPIREEAVERYKFQQHAKQWTKAIACQIAVLALGLYGGSLALNITSAALGIPAMFACAALLIGGSGFTWAGFNPVGWEWRRFSLNGYERPIPAHIVSTAMLIANALSAVKNRNVFGESVNSRSNFIVEEFRERETSLVADPFLIVEHNGARAYIAVWDEPTFKD